MRAADFDRRSQRVNPENLPRRSIDPQTLRQHLLKPGDLVLEKSGGGDKQPVGAAVLFDLDEPAVCTNFCARITPAPGIDPRYLSYVFAAAYNQGLTQSAIKQTTGIQNLDSAAFFSSPWAHPGTDEQRRIADFLDGETAHIEKMLKLTSRQIDLLRYRFTEYLRTRTTVGRSKETTRTGVEWMPTMADGWQLHRLGRVFHTGSGTTPKSDNPRYFDGDHPWVNTGDLRDGSVKQAGKTVTDAALTDYSSLRMYEAGSLAVAMYGATVGRVGILTFRACVNQACCVLYKPTAVSTEFLFNWFVAHRPEILNLTSGGGQPNISQDLVRSLRVPAPSLSDQHDIVSEIQRNRMLSERQMTDLSRRLDLLTERRQALITAAVTGQLDVTTARSGVR
ncbi:hypothetical protein ALI22I_17895 [Saccharothrix sp. ALI-22-I]|nr:hypothetical protein ALI22I_17895 [Saccharothrix sp. ALI-22-I]